MTTKLKEPIHHRIGSASHPGILIRVSKTYTADHSLSRIPKFWIFFYWSSQATVACSPHCLALPHSSLSQSCHAPPFITQLRPLLLTSACENYASNSLFVSFFLLLGKTLSHENLKKSEQKQKSDKVYRYRPMTYNCEELRMMPTLPLMRWSRASHDTELTFAYCFVTLLCSFCHKDLVLVLHLFFQLYLATCRQKFKAISSPKFGFQLCLRMLG